MSDTKTTDELAGIFNVTPKTVRAWVDAGMPVLVEGKQGRGRKTQASLQAAVRWYFQTNFERLELDRARTRLANEQGLKESLANAQRRGQLCMVEHVGWVLNRHAHMHVGQLESLTGRLPALLGGITDPGAQREVILGEVRNIREACARSIENMANEMDADKLNNAQVAALQRYLGVEKPARSPKPSKKPRKKK